MSYAIWDLDNCLAADEWRIPRIDWAQDDLMRRYHAYHLLAGFDRVGNLRRFVTETEVYDLCPLFFTSRPVGYRPITEEWIRRNLHWPRAGGHLLMRNDNDHSSSVSVKRKMLDWLPHYDIALSDIAIAFDDRPDIVEMYRAAGLVAEVLSIHATCAMTRPKESVHG